MATAVLTKPVKLKMVNTEARLGEDTVGPGLLTDLQTYYENPAAPIQDQAKCLELITSVNLGQSVQEHAQQRPHTAIPAAGEDHRKNFLSPYQTTHNRDYPDRQPRSTADTLAIRPMTSHGYPPQIGYPPETNYTDEYRKKSIRPITPTRPGSASGNRANNPHPLQAFLVWKFPRKGPIETEGSRWTEELTDDKMNQVHKRLCQSTYQTDYLGVPQGFQVKTAYALPPDWKENVPYTLDTVKRYSFQSHAQPPEVQVPSTRYGSNKKKQIPACGTIPTASNRFMHIRNRTTYDRHYNDNSDAVTQQIRELGQKLGAEALRKYYQTASGEDRMIAKSLLEAYRGRKVTPTPPATPQPPRPASMRSHSRIYNKSTTPACTPLYSPYIPDPSPKVQSPRISDAPYSPPNYLNH